jgi:hypothetical protein
LNKIELEANEDLSYLADASAYADNYWNRVSQAKLVEHIIDEAKPKILKMLVQLTLSDECFRRLKKVASWCMPYKRL